MNDLRDRIAARRLALALTIALALLAGGIVLLLPGAASGLGELFSPGLGLKRAAVIAFFVTIAVLVLLMLAAGDGLLGELQYTLLGFFGFFLIFWLMIAWIF